MGAVSVSELETCNEGDGAGVLTWDEFSVDFLRAASDVDPIEEMRLRTWARKNYAPAGERHTDWHPVILDEMIRKDEE